MSTRGAIPSRGYRIAAISIEPVNSCSFCRIGAAAALPLRQRSSQISCNFPAIRLEWNRRKFMSAH
jgi:hypothetical protein